MTDVTQFFVQNEVAEVSQKFYSKECSQNFTMLANTKIRTKSRKIKWSSLVPDFFFFCFRKTRSQVSSSVKCAYCTNSYNRINLPQESGNHQ